MDEETTRRGYWTTVFMQVEEQNAQQTEYSSAINALSDRSPSELAGNI
jgi:hypothetical protein